MLDFSEEGIVKREKVMTEGCHSATPYFDGYKTSILSPNFTGSMTAWFRTENDMAREENVRVFTEA